MVISSGVCVFISQTTRCAQAHCDKSGAAATCFLLYTWIKKKNRYTHTRKHENIWKKRRNNIVYCMLIKNIFLEIASKMKKRGKP